MSRPPGPVRAPGSLLARAVAAIRRRFRPHAGRPSGPNSGPARLPIDERAGADEPDAPASIVDALPPGAFPLDSRFDFYAAAAPARSVSGDLVDLFFTSDARVMLVLADAAGKGISAAMFASTARAVIRDLATGGGPQADGSSPPPPARSHSPADVLAGASRLLLEANPAAMFASAVLVSFDPATGAIGCASAGHPLPLIVDGRGAARTLGSRDLVAGDAALPTRAGTVMGVVEQHEFPLVADRLAPGEMLVLFSDGVIEARAPAASAAHEFLGVAGLAQVCRRAVTDHAAGRRSLDAESLCRDVLKAVAAFQHGRLHDDASVLVLRRV
ncbi:MAG: PP2C family protein-serine/threonine phosphatase [Phycisphaerales bacterium]